MWVATIIFSVLFFAFLALAFYHLKDGNPLKAFAFGAGSLSMFVLVLLFTAEAGNKAPRIIGGHFYEVVATMSIPNGDGTLVYATDLKGGKKKADILAEYPLKGYKVVQSGKRTFLIPEDTRIAIDTKEGGTILISKEGEAISAPAVLATQ